MTVETARPTLTWQEEDWIRDHGTDYEKAALLYIFQKTRHVPSCTLNGHDIYCIDCACIAGPISQDLKARGLTTYPEGVRDEVDAEGWTR